MASKSSAQRIELTKNQLIFLSALSILIIAVYLTNTYAPKPILNIAVYLTNTYAPKPIYSYDYFGIPLNFRADLREAAKVQIYPNEANLYYELRGGLAKNITIVFQPVEGDNGIYTADAFEIANKLNFLFKNVLGRNVTIDAMNVTSYDNLPGKIQHPIIALVHPKYSTETSVSLVGHVIRISGLPSNDARTPYQNLDLATVRFLMIILGINDFD